MKARYLGILLGVGLLSVCCACLGAKWPLESLFYLAAGWALYLYRVVPEMSVSWSGIATAIVCLVLLAVGLHRFLRWLYTARPSVAGTPAREWPRRWTATILGVVVLMFVAGIAAVGVTHQTAWLMTSPEPIIVPSGSVRRMMVGNDLHQLSIALMEYAADHNQTLPAHAIFDPEGRPLPSWRVTILPYIEQKQLFNEFHLDEPWDSPHNLQLLPRMPRAYAPFSKRGNPKEHATFLQVFVGKGAAFEDHEGLRYTDDFPDGTGNTILVVEGATAVPWTKPADLAYYPDASLPPLGAMSAKYFIVGLADGSAKPVFTKGLREATLRAAITRNGNDVLGDDW
jgi:Protein of unknown function (DUF1559)